MQVQTSLRGMFHYSTFPIILFLALILITIGIKIIFRKKPAQDVLKLPPKKDASLLKKEYLEKLDALNIKYKDHKIDNRHAFLELSSLVRHFIFEATNLRVQNYTLAEIKTLNLPNLTAIVSEYYDPEFRKNSPGNFESSIEKTKEVIKKWA